MTDVAAAQASLQQAQELLEQVTADMVRFDEVITWIGEASARVHQLQEYYTGQGQADIQTVLAADPEAVTPAVGNEDAAWEALGDHDERMLRLLRLVTSVLTSRLDDPA